MLANDPLVISFNSPVSIKDSPGRFSDPFQKIPHPLAVRAAYELQEKLDHFGIIKDMGGERNGKMFGVLVVKAEYGTLGYLAGFSGKLNIRQLNVDFVPPIADGLLPGGALDAGMKDLDRYKQRIEELETVQANEEKRTLLIQARKAHSNSLNEQIYDSFHCLNQAGESKSMRDIFENTHHANPPGGAGDCAAPRLLQYAFKQQLTPLAMAEFWWGQSTKATRWQHGEFYPPCTHKCRPILAHMLEGLFNLKPY